MFYGIEKTLKKVKLILNKAHYEITIIYTYHLQIQSGKH